MSVHAIQAPFDAKNLNTNDTLLWGNERCSVKAIDKECQRQSKTDPLYC